MNNITRFEPLNELARFNPLLTQFDPFSDMDDVLNRFMMRPILRGGMDIEKKRRKKPKKKKKA